MEENITNQIMHPLFNTITEPQFSPIMGEGFDTFTSIDIKIENLIQ